MATETGPSDDDLTPRETELATDLRRLEPLRSVPGSFDFFGALRLIEAVVRDGANVGFAAHPADEKVRLRHRATMTHTLDTVAGFGLSDPTPAGGPATGHLTLWTHFLGLVGAEGPMPAYQYRVPHRDPADCGPAQRILSDLYDVFHHRMLASFYRVWADGEMTVNYQHEAVAKRRPGTANHDRRGDLDRFRIYLGSLIGLGTPATWDGDAVPDSAKLHYAGRLACPTRNAEGLAAILEGYFSVPVSIVECVRQWIDIPHEHLCRLGGRPETSTLGWDRDGGAVIGDQVLDVQQRFRIAVGPVRLSEYLRLLPRPARRADRPFPGRGLGWRRLKAWVRNYVLEPLDWDLHLRVHVERPPECRLGRSRRLGYSAWLVDVASDEPGNRHLDHEVAVPSTELG